MEKFYNPEFSSYTDIVDCPLQKVYLGSIALEKNRWAPGRIPTYSVSDYIQRIKADGFDGIELWQYHYLSASEAEKEKLRNAGVEIIFNSYMQLADGVTDTMFQTAEAIRQLNATAVKYNFGKAHQENDWEALRRQTQTLLYFADLLPKKTRLLCECHPGTLGADPEHIARIFEEMDERFGAMIHLITPLDFAERCFDCYGDRICHIHSCYSLPDVGFQSLASGESKVKEHYQYYVSRGFQGTVTIEFVENGDTPDQYYENAVKDLKFWKKLLPQTPPPAAQR